MMEQAEQCWGEEEVCSAQLKSFHIGFPVRSLGCSERWLHKLIASRSSVNRELSRLPQGLECCNPLQGVFAGEEDAGASLHDGSRLLLPFVLLGQTCWPVMWSTAV